MGLTEKEVKMVADNRYFQKTKWWFWGGFAVVIVALIVVAALTPTSTAKSYYNLPGCGVLEISGSVVSVDGEILEKAGSDRASIDMPGILVLLGIFVLAILVAWLMFSRPQNRYSKQFVEKWKDTGEIPEG